MAQILRPKIEFTSNSQNKAKVSFDVKFTNSEISGGSPHSLSGFPGSSQISLPASYFYTARVVLQVIRVVPQPFIRGTPPPPLPDPVTLQIVTLSVKMPKKGNTTSLDNTFTYQLLGNDPLVFDTLFADIILISRFRIGFSGSDFISYPVASSSTNFISIDGVDLKNPQDNGVVIP